MSFRDQLVLGIESLSEKLAFRDSVIREKQLQIDELEAEIEELSDGFEPIRKDRAYLINELAEFDELDRLSKMS